MNLRKQYLTDNECYQIGEKMIPKGIMIHSTGANNPNISRYVQPDDGKLGINKYGNHWNQSSIEVCVHGFIGKDASGNICTYQTLPWNYVGWHCGSGVNGSGNRSYIGIEICEDDLSNKNYFEAIYKEAIEVSAYLCELYNLNPLGENVIICHQDGYKLGIASNHIDIYHWFSKYGVTMQKMRQDIAKQIKTQSKLQVGQKVYLSDNAQYYVTGERIPDWVKNKSYTIMEIGNDKILLKEIMSWVYIQDVQGAQTDFSNKLQVGSKVTVINPIDWYGTTLSTSGIYEIIELKDKRAVIGRNRVVTAAINVDYLKLA